MYKYGRAVRFISGSSTAQTHISPTKHYPSINLITFTMHFTAPALIAILSATVAVAAPTAGKDDHKPSHYNREKYQKDCDQDWEKKWKNDDWKKDENLFYYNSEYYVKATPDQVISNAGVPTPGQPGAKGIFKYGINVAENTICYVSHPLSIKILAIS
jgi:hypothetical protein